MKALQLAPLAAAQDGLALELLDQAFADDPSLGWYLFAERPRFGERRRAYLASYQRFHRSNRLPTLAAWHGQRLLGLSYFSLGGEVPSSASLEQIGQAIRQHCTEECLARLDRLLEAFDQHLQPLACARLEFLAVAPGLQGQGVGGALLQQTLSECRRRGCAAMALETGNPANLPFYQRHGWRQHGELHLEGLHQRYLRHDLRPGERLQSR
ncbi:GNAT family N-acetyltransferase [Pseudomonas zhanjiangensis]|uniref:GNAT family N-acetyltransferase n=1 Tax=Pseudomonas zhanjiangensis TaxID=3239015 RepID=A0ABV3YNM5_9PSED